LGGGAIGLAPPPATINNGSTKNYQDDTAYFAIKMKQPRRNQNMKTTFKIQLTRIAPGRMVLHFGCLLRGGRWEFHWAGMRRELKAIVKPIVRFTAIGGRSRQILESR